MLGGAIMDDVKTRRLKSLESMILHASTNPNERQAAIGRWEAISGEKWTGKAKATTASASNNTKKSNDGWSDFYADFNKYTQQKQQQQQSYYQNFDRSDWFKNAKERAQQQQQRQQGFNKQYDYSKDECTQKQWEYVKSISDFFRWKCPNRDKMGFQEATDFLNSYSKIFKSFNPATRSYDVLVSLFAAMGVDFKTETKRTWKWKAFGEKE